jgi:2,4-dienoyl-CoA reductase-like NADH-dependent reductase (Old Yellow Enzyme family)
MLDVSPLFQPYTLRGTPFRYRIAMAPMTRSHSPGAAPNAENVAYYKRRAAGEVGLIISEGTLTRRKGATNDPNIPNFFGEAALAGWKQVIDAVHAAGGKMAPQVWHQGMMRKPGTGPNPEAPSDGPSGVTVTGKKVAEEPSEADVLDMADAYAEAAGDAIRLGFDSVELHGAHSYLIDDFFWQVTNQRADRFGGSFEKRSAFAVECIRRCRKAMDAAGGAERPLIIRISQWKQTDYAYKTAKTPQEMEQWLRPLVEAGVDMIHCSQRRIWEPEFPEVDGADGLNCAGWAKKVTGLPTMAVGSVGLDGGDFTASFAGQGATRGKLDWTVERLAKGEFDMVAVGRALLQDPDWAIKVKEGRFDDLRDYDGAALKTYF